MAFIRSRKHSADFLALATLALPTAVGAQQAAPGDAVLPDVKITAQAAGVDAPYKADKASSPKFTQPLVDTTQTVSIIKKELLQEQGAATLMDALRNTPGITMQLGENGSTSTGDAFQMRGFSTQTATFVDGIRDLGAVTRDVFNVEQVEVVKGPAGADIGRGAVSGYINLVSKLPTLEDAYSGGVSWQTGDTKRATADLNKKLGETSALRLNLLVQDGGVAKRDTVENRNVAVAPGLALGLNTPTRFYIYSQHIRQDNVPDGGIPTIGMEGFYNASSLLQHGSKVNRENYYGAQGDYEKVNADMLTVKVEHDLGSGTTLRNMTRYGKTTMDRVMTGIYTLAAPSANTATWTVSRLRQRVDQENEILANQTTLNTEFNTGGLKHSLVAGLELMYEKQRNLSFSTTGKTVTAASLYQPNSGDVMAVPYPTGAYTDGNTLTTAAFIFDTLKLNERWQLNAGVRFDHYDTSTNAVTATQNATTGAVTALTPSTLNKNGNLTSWKVGGLYKPAQNGSLYAAYAVAKTPPGSGSFALSGTASSSENANLAPQEANSAELGTKWDLLDNKLALTAAVYRTENKNEVSYDPVDAVYTQSGKRRVEGVELGLVGQITPAWQISAGIATMKTKVLEGQSFSTTSGTTNNAGGGVRWSPDLTATLWTTYTLGGWTFGGGTRYVSDQKRYVTPGGDTSTQLMPKIPAYWVTDAMASYRLDRHTTLRLNLNNVFDKEYISTLNNSGARATMGAPRTVMVSANFQF